MKRKRDKEREEKERREGRGSPEIESGRNWGKRRQKEKGAERQWRNTGSELNPSAATCITLPNSASVSPSVKWDEEVYPAGDLRELNELRCVRIIPARPLRKHTMSGRPVGGGGEGGCLHGFFPRTQLLHCVPGLASLESRAQASTLKRQQLVEHPPGAFGCRVSARRALIPVVPPAARQRAAGARAATNELPTKTVCFTRIPIHNLYWSLQSHYDH